MLSTQCPECGTKFRVNAEQLKLRHGMVRCGHCRHVFNGVTQLSYVPDDTQTLKLRREQEQVQQQTQTPASAPAQAPEESTQQAAHEAAVQAHHSANYTAAPSQHQELNHAIEEASQFSRSVAPETPEPIQDAEALLNPPTLMSTDDTAPPQHNSPTFLIRAKRPRWRTALYALTNLILLAVLIGQGMYVFRDQLRAEIPALEPLLQAGCAVLHCQLGWPQEPSLVSVEVSELQAAENHPELQTLRVALRNRARTPVQLPALEVWLTDTQNLPIVRKVLRPAEYLPAMVGGANASNINQRTGLPPDTELPLQIHWESKASGASGYRVYLFYPE